MRCATSGIPGQVPIIGEVDNRSIAWENNIRSGDRILSVGNRAVDTWQGSLISMIGEVLNDERIEISLIDESNQKKEIILDVQGRTKELTAPNALFPGLGFKPFQPKINPVVVSVVEGSPASFSGVEPGDILVKIDDIEIENLDHWRTFEIPCGRMGHPQTHSDARKSSGASRFTFFLDGTTSFVGLGKRA